MSNFAITIEIPALDRLCDLLARQGLPRTAQAAPEAVASETIGQPDKPVAVPASPAPVPSPAPVAQAATALSASNTPLTASNTPSNTPLTAPNAQSTPPVAPAPAIQTTAPAVTLEAIMRAAAGLRDAGKLPQVTALFPEFGIQKLSDLSPDQLPGFAAKLRGLGARIG